VTAAVDELHKVMDVWRFNGDPPHWTETMGSWAGRHESVEEWWTNRIKAMAYAVRNYKEAHDTAAVKFVDDDREDEFSRHCAAAGKQLTNLYDDNGERLFVLKKIHPDRKFDYAMAAILSWEARLAALKANAQPRRRSSGRVKRLR